MDLEITNTIRFHFDTLLHLRAIPSAGAFRVNFLGNGNETLNFNALPVDGRKVRTSIHYTSPVIRTLSFAFGYSLNAQHMNTLLALDSVRFKHPRVHPGFWSLI